MKQAPSNPSPQLRTAAAVAEALRSLPAVPNPNWCESAAAAIHPVHPCATALVAIGNLIDDRKSQYVRPITAGVAGTLPSNAARKPVLAAGSSHPRLAAMLTRLARTSHLGWSPGEIAPGRHRVGVVRGIDDLPDWTRTALGWRWSLVGSTNVVLAAITLPGEPFDVEEYSPLYAADETDDAPDTRTTDSNGEHPVAAADDDHTAGTPGARVLTLELGAHTRDTNALRDAASILDALMPILARAASRMLGPPDRPGPQWLTAREQYVLHHLLLGKSVVQIARLIDRSPYTVHDHIKSLHRKLGTTSRGHLVARALGNADSFENEPHPCPIPEADNPFIHVRRPIRATR